MRQATIMLGLLSVSVGLLGCQKTEPLEAEANSVPKAVALIRVAHIDAQGQQETTDAFERFRQTQIQLITSPFVINAALRELYPDDLEILRGHEKPLDWLMNQIQVQPVSEIIRISMRGEQEDEIVKVVQAVVEAYLNEITNSEREERSRRLQNTREEQRKLMNEIKDKASFINGMSEKLGATPKETSEIARQRLMHEVELAQERIKHLSLRLDDLVIQKQSAEANGDKKDLPPIVAQVNAVEELLTNVKADYQRHLEQLKDTFVFSADLDMRVFEVEQLKRQLEDVMSDVGTLERSLSNPPRITLVQPAIIVEVEDSPEEGESDAEESDAEESDAGESDDDASKEDVVSI